MQVRWIKLKSIPDQRGGLVAAEAQREIPFLIKRVYCLYGMNANGRGFHAHKALNQVMVCLKGHCKVKLDNGTDAPEEINMHEPDKGLWIGKMIWHEMYDFSEDCVLLVFASEYYDESDYIRDYDEFSEVARK